MTTTGQFAEIDGSGGRACERRVGRSCSNKDRPWYTVGGEAAT